MKAWTKKAALALALLLALLATGCAKQEAEPVEEEAKPDRSLVIGYAEEGVTVVRDPDSLSKAVDEMLQEESSNIWLSYQNDAYSVDGINFTCYIGNSDSNAYDAFIQIFADENFQDELFLSQLLRPGQAFETLTLNHALPKDSTTQCYIALTQVEIVDGEQSIRSQTFFTVDFHVA